MSTIIIITPKKKNAAVDFTGESAELQAPSDFNQDAQFDNVSPEVVKEVIVLLTKDSDDPGC